VPVAPDDEFRDDLDELLELGLGSGLGLGKFCEGGFES
jgi:hypothetical protein